MRIKDIGTRSSNSSTGVYSTQERMQISEGEEEKEKEERKEEEENKKNKKKIEVVKEKHYFHLGHPSMY